MMNRRQRSSKQRSVKAPAAQGSVKTISSPSINGDDTIRVKKRELVTTIRDWKNAIPDKLRIDPTDPSTFPWLSQLSRLYELYRINSLKFEFASAAPTTQEGAFFLGIDYDPSDSDPGTLETLMTFVGSRRAPIWSNATCTFDPKRVFKPWLFTATSAGTQDRLETPGNFYWATTANEASAEIGEIYVSYDISFKNTQTPTDRYHHRFGRWQDLQLPKPGNQWFIEEDPVGKANTTIELDSRPAGLDIKPKKPGLYRIRLSAVAESLTNLYNAIPIGGALIRNTGVKEVFDLTDTLKQQVLEALVYFPPTKDSDLPSALRLRNGTGLMKAGTLTAAYIGAKLLGARTHYGDANMTFG